MELPYALHLFSFLIHIETLISHITFIPPYKSHLLNTILFSLFRISVLLWRERRRSIDHVIQDASQTPHIDLILSKILMPPWKVEGWDWDSSGFSSMTLSYVVSFCWNVWGWIRCQDLDLRVYLPKIGNLILHTETPVSTCTVSTLDSLVPTSDFQIWTCMTCKNKCIVLIYFPIYSEISTRFFREAQVHQLWVQFPEGKCSAIEARKSSIK